MSKLTVSIMLLLGAAAGMGLGYWMALPEPTGPTLPPSRSVTTLPDDFAPPGVAGEVRRALLILDVFERTATLATLLPTLGPESLEAVREAYESVLLDLGDTELVLFGEWWASFDPSTAMRWTKYNWNTRSSMPVIRGVMRAWGRSDPIAAIAASHAAANANVRRRWIDSILRGWDESVQDGALGFAESMGAGPDRQWALYVVTRRRILRDGPESVIEWAEGLPEEDEFFKLNVYRRVAGGLAEVDPPLATDFVERHLEGPYAKGLPRRVGMRWVSHDPEAAMLWLSTLSPGANRDDGVQESYRSWLMLDRPAAMQWIAGAEVERWLEPALSIYAKALGRTDPVEALRAASEMQDASLRNPTLGVVAREWLVRDEAAANVWLDQSDLPPEYIAKIRVIPEGMRHFSEKK